LREATAVLKRTPEICELGDVLGISVHQSIEQFGEVRARLLELFRRPVVGFSRGDDVPDCLVPVRDAIRETWIGGDA